MKSEGIIGVFIEELITHDWLIPIELIFCKYYLYLWVYFQKLNRLADAKSHIFNR